MKFLTSVFALLYASTYLAGCVQAFIMPTTAFVSHSRGRCSRQHPQPVKPGQMLPSILLADELETAVEQLDAGGGGNGFLDGLKTFGLAITAVLFLGVGIAYLTASVLIPKAAEQLEEETKRLRPDLWDEYQAKLQPGETMAMRPDLLQQLGDIMQPIIVADMDAQAGRIEKENDDLMQKLDTEEAQVAPVEVTNAVDAVVVEPEDEESSEDDSSGEKEIAQTDDEEADDDDDEASEYGNSEGEVSKDDSAEEDATEEEEEEASEDDSSGEEAAATEEEEPAEDDSSEAEAPGAEEEEPAEDDSSEEEASGVAEEEPAEDDSSEDEAAEAEDDSGEEDASSNDSSGEDS